MCAFLDFTCVVRLSTAPEPEISFNYVVRIINPSKKSDFVVHTWHGVNSKFSSRQALKEKLIETFPEQLEASPDFKLGYFEKPGNSKRWIGTNEDLVGMYGCFHSNESTITLWCEGKKDESQKAHTATEKRKGRQCMEDCSEPLSKRAKKDEDIDAAFRKLHDKHSDDYSDPQLRLWARMYVNGLHDDFDTPPNVPAITGQPVRRKRGDHGVQPPSLMPSQGQQLPSQKF